MLNQQFLEQLQSEFHLGKVHFAPTLSSTNDLASDWLHAGCPDFSLIVANEQTKGKGRSGRRWYTNPESALAFSLIITNLKLPTNLYNGLTSTSLVQALSVFTRESIQIKWPNDILIGGKKVCGILIESSWSGDQMNGIILGIGVNIFEDSLNIQEELRFPASYLKRHSNASFDRGIILRQIIRHLVDFHGPELQDEILQSWNQHLAYKNLQVQALRHEGDLISGKLLGVSKKGLLEIQLPDSSIVEYNANEIQKIRSA